MKDKIIRYIKLFISIILMYLLFKQVNIDEFRGVLQQVSKKGILIVVVFYLISIIFNAIKWHVLLRNTDLKALIGLSYRAQLYATVLPGQLFGEASKITGWTNKNEDMSVVSASVLFDKITGLIGQIVLGIIGIYLSKASEGVHNKWLLIVLLVMGLIAVYLSTEKHIVNTVRRLIRLVGRFNHKIEEKLMSFYESWICFSGNKQIVIKSILWGMLNQMMGIISVWYLSEKMGLAIGIIEYCWIIPLMSFILLLPVSFAGIGLRDASIASMLSIFGVSTGNALIISVSLLLGQLVASAIGAVLVLKNNLGISME